MIIKAFFKAYAHKWYQKTPSDESGDGTFVHAVTGLVPEKVRLTDQWEQGIDLLRRSLGDDHYFNKKTYVSCYCSNSFKPKIPS
mgnify:CR=1 FL=1